MQSAWLVNVACVTKSAAGAARSRCSGACTKTRRDVLFVVGEFSSLRKAGFDRIRSWPEGRRGSRRQRQVYKQSAHVDLRQQSGRGRALVTALPHAKRTSIVRMQVKSPQGTFRFAPLKALDPPKLAARSTRHSVNPNTEAV
jgi:hypothetical protein